MHRNRRVGSFSHSLTMQDYRLVQDWAARLNVEIGLEMDRPRRLLVIINPYGGAKQAMDTWEKIVEPIFQNAGAVVPST